MKAWKWWFFFQKDFWVGARCLALCLWRNSTIQLSTVIQAFRVNCSFLVWIKDSGSWELLPLCGFLMDTDFVMKDGMWVGQGVSCNKAAVETVEDILAELLFVTLRVPHNLIQAPPLKVTCRVNSLLWGVVVTAANILFPPSSGPPTISQK